MKLRAADHQGMKVDYTCMLGQVRDCLLHAQRNTLHAEMLRQMQGHLKEMGERFYAGDPSAVDEFLQLYCIARDRRATPVPVDTEAAIQRLAGELPEGYVVEMGVELGAGWVDLCLPDTDAQEHIYSDEGTMGERLLAALERAKELAGGAACPPA